MGLAESNDWLVRVVTGSVVFKRIGARIGEAERRCRAGNRVPPAIDADKGVTIRNKRFTAIARGHEKLKIRDEDDSNQEDCTTF